MNTVQTQKKESTFIHGFQEIFTKPCYASGDTLGSEETVGNKKDNISAQKKKKKTTIIFTVVDMIQERKQGRYKVTCLRSGTEGGLLPDLDIL